ncbi:MAG: polysaccharide deacetylase family protein [Acutalibacteraceae bacterium]
MKKRNKLVVYLSATVIILVALITVVITSAKSNLTAPQEISARNEQDSIVLNWKNVRGASNYEIYKEVSDQWQLLETTKEETYADNSVNDGKTYNYKVRAKSSIAEGEFAQIKFLYLSEPVISDTENTTEGIRISWNKAKKAKIYTVLRKEIVSSQESSEWAQIKELPASKTSYTDSDTKNGKTYSYCIRQSNGKYESGYGNHAQEVICSEAVKNLQVSNSPNGVTLTWKNFSDATGYSILRKADGDETWNEIATIDAKTTYIDKTAVYGKKNSYKVCALLSDGQKSALSAASSLYGIDPNKKMVALTFDDGPYRPVTTKILDTAEKYGARVTFYIVGSRVDTYSDCVERASKLGCEIGCHTFNHTILTTCSNEVRQKEISDTNDVVKKYTGIGIKTVRCPGGAVNDEVKQTVKYPLINWSVDTLDWKTRNSEATMNNIKNHVADGSIVLMHDLYESTGNAMVEIIPYLINQGYQLVTVSEMMEAKGVKPVNGQLYFSITG